MVDLSYDGSMQVSIDEKMKQSKEKNSSKDVQSLIGQRLRILRKNQGLTLDQLSDQIGITQSHISMIENQKTVPSLKTLLLLANKFDVDISYFFEMKNDTRVTVLSHDQYKISCQDENSLFRNLTDFLASNCFKAYDLETYKKSLIKLPSQLKGRLYFYCIHGAFRFVVARSSYYLDPGYSLYLEGDATFRLYSETDSAKCVVIQMFHLP